VRSGFDRAADRWREDYAIVGAAKRLAQQIAGLVSIRHTAAQALRT
jgi:hypothetical protein